jgi:carnitine 3-dehydrogenase
MGRAAVLGAGVVGAGWAARFALHGWSVSVYDPMVSTDRVETVVDRARQSLAALYDCPLPEEGALSFTADVGEAVSEADWVQESVPERLEIKRDLYAVVSRHLAAGAVLASSTSGFRPSVLAEDLPCAERFLVCHPFQPVYLLPAVELVPSRWTSDAVVTSAVSKLESVGMSPIRIGKEIDAHVADRLLEAIWREALWLIRDGIATTEEIDAVIRNGFGLRWAQMGLFETYRIAGGDAGMRHFLAQFGPALKWPWSRLTDVPEMDAELINLIAGQSDEQAAGRSISELADERDLNLVAILKALKSTDSGAGRVVAAFESRLGQTSSTDRGN